MALSMILGIPDLAHTYIWSVWKQPAAIYMPLASHTHHKAARSAPCQTLISQDAHLISATV